MEDVPLVSVCLLTYNRAGQLRQTLDSIFAQTYQNWELIINDDCSPDETEQICREYQNRDSRVRYYRNARNLRYAGNQSAAIQRARSEYVAILHDGDIYHPQLVGKWLTTLQRNPSAALIFNGYAHQKHPRKTILPLMECSPGRQLFDLTFSLGISPIWGIVMVRKSCVIEAGPFDERFPVIADVDMWLRLMLRHDVAYIPEILLTIAGREIDHPNKASNWKVHEQEDMLWILNAERAYPKTDPMYFAVQKQVAMMIWRNNLLCLGWCFASARLVSFFQGLRHCLTHSRRRRRILAAGVDPKGRWPLSTSD